MSKLMDFLKEERTRLNRTQEDVADNLGVTSSTISRWETGEITPNLEQVMAYADTLGVAPATVFAIYANVDLTLPMAIAELVIEVFSKEAYDAIMKVVLEQGLEVNITTKRK